MMKINIMKKGNIVTYVKRFWYNKENKSKYDVYHKLRDYCHYTGQFRWDAHNICNL